MFLWDIVFKFAMESRWWMDRDVDLDIDNMMGSKEDEGSKESWSYKSRVGSRMERIL